ncbi:hypothetical protein T09_6889 [Trichinella sp. T9]|nr:hypothetical protein T09_6889 [Trichinella sp. T9]
MFQDFLFGLQNIVKLKGTLLDCWGRPHPTLEKHVYKAGIFSSCGLCFVKFVKQITNLSITRYSAHFDTKLSCIVIHWPPPGASLACVYQYRLV